MTYKSNLSIAIVAGGLSHEREVSLESGARVAYALRSLGHSTVLIDLDNAGVATLLSGDVDVAINLLHGGAGEDGTSQSIIEMCNIPAVGAGASAARLTYDKVCASEVLTRCGLGVPHSMVMSYSLLRELGTRLILDRLADRFGFPLVVKPRAGGSAMGFSVVRDRAGLADALITALRYDELAIVQEYVSGPELAISIVDVGDGPVCLTPLQVVLPAGEVFDYEHRYTAGLIQILPNPDLGTNLLEECERVALTAFTSLGLRDYGRIDVIVGPDGPCVLEAAVNPGMTATSLWAVAAGASSLDFAVAWGGLVDMAMQRGNLLHRIGFSSIADADAHR